MADPPPADPTEEEADDGEFPFLKADHPLLARVQRALHEQLSGQHERVRLQLKENEEERRKLIKHREDVGVTLYGAQQQLAKLQLQLEQIHDSVAVVLRQREDADQKVVESTQKYEGEKKKVDGQLKKLQKVQDELNQLEITLRQVQNYNKEMRDEIAVTRRATHKAEENIKHIEKVKTTQDLMIDRINEEIKRLTEQKALHEAQLVAQKQETEAAIATLTEAGREMEAVEFERKQLNQQLKSSLRGMMRRDGAFQNVDNALRDLEEQEMVLDAEMRGLARSGAETQEKNEQLAALLAKNEHEMTYLQGQMTQIKTDRERLAEQYAMLRKSLDHTTTEAQAVKARAKEASQDLALVEGCVQKLSRENAALFDNIEEKLNEQNAVKRSESNTRKSAKKLGQLLKDQDVELQNLQNEISRVMVDSLNTKAHNQMLKDRLAQLAKDLAEREKLIDQYEQQIRKRHNEIEKKQLNVDRLNREFDDKRSKQDGDESTGPLEGTIKGIRKQSAEKAADCAEMQKSWIKKQTELLNLQEEIDRHKDHVQDQKNRKLVLDQKKIRTEGDWRAQKKEIVDLNSDVKQMQQDMDKLNNLLAKSMLQQESLGNTTQTMETEFVRKLKEIEHNCVEIENDVEILQSEKDQMMEEIVEAERQVMLWERKIHLEKEMQEALDPNVGQAETSNMKREIHRMELRYEQLKRRQDLMIMEMERVIHKRDAIQLKYEPVASKDGGANTGAEVKRQIQSLRNNLRLCTQAAQETESRMRQREEDLKDLQHNLEQATLETGELERSVEEAQMDAQLRQADHARKAAEKASVQQRVDRISEVLETGVGVPPARAAGLVAQVNDVTGTRKRIEDTLGEVREACPQLENLLGVFRDWISMTGDLAPVIEAA